MDADWEWVLEIDVKGGPGSGNFGHAGRPGQVGGSGPGKGGGGSRFVTESYFESGHGKQLLEGLSRNQQRDVVAVLTDGKVRPEHLEGLKRITTEAPVFSGKWADYRNGTALGAYNLDEKTIYVRPDSDGGFSWNTLSHELGHHVTTRSGWRFSNKGTEAYRTMWDNAFGKWSWAKPSAKELGEFGLRDYSMTNFDEFQAEVWMIHQRGFKAQRQRLAVQLGVDSLDSLFEVGTW